MEAAIDRLTREVGVPDLNDAYEEIYRINTSGGDKARLYLERAFSFLICFSLPLHLGTLAMGISIEADGSMDEYVDERYCRGICSNFVVLDSDGYLRFAHLSVREFVEDKLHCFLSQANEQVATATVAYMLYRFSGFKTYRNPLDFATYSFMKWPEHCERANTRRMSGTLRKLFLDMTLDKNGAFSKWTELIPVHFQEQYPFNDIKQLIFRLSSSRSDPPNPNFVAASFGFYEFFTELLWTGSLDLEERNHKGNTPLHVAAEEGQYEVVRLILISRPNVSVELRNDFNWTLLCTAAKYGRANVMRLLLDRGADPVGSIGQIPLHGAAA